MHLTLLAAQSMSHSLGKFGASADSVNTLIKYMMHIVSWILQYLDE